MLDMPFSAPAGYRPLWVRVTLLFWAPPWLSHRMVMVRVFGEPALGVDGRAAAAAGGGDGLPVGVIDQVVGGEDAGNLGRGTRMRDDHIALAVELDLAAGADKAQTAEVAMVVAAVCAGGTAAHGVMALRLFDESLSATRTEPQR